MIHLSNRHKSDTLLINPHSFSLARLVEKQRRMAEALAVVTPVVDMLIKLLMKEGKSFKRLHREVKSLKDELECVKGFLIDAEQRSDKEETREGVKVWLKQVREEAYHIEDVIDLYLLYMAQRLHSHGIAGFLRRTRYFFKALKPHHDIVSEIGDIKESLREIKDRGERYGFNSLLQGSSSWVNEVDHCSVRLGSLFIADNEFLDIHCIRDELTTNLLEGTSTRKVISLAGMGGIGKTTLAKKVYDAKVVKAHFDCCAWITVSQSCNFEKLLGTMAKQLCPEMKIDRIDEQIECLRHVLETKRYVIVFDDVWQLEFWGIIKHALPNSDNGSRIIVTTRNDKVATSCKDNSGDIVKKLEPLSREMALQLFYKKAFPCESRGYCPQDLAELSIEIVQKCQGLPLVISSIAGLLSTKEKVLSEWRKYYDTLNSELDTNPNLSSISRILSLSYVKLPGYLKPCLLYFGMFPSNRFILDFTLYSHWIAEGLIKEKRDKTLQQVAAEYLNELIQRNLVQVHGLFNGDKLCQVHDLMRDIIVLRANEWGFYNIVDENKSTFRGKCRRLSVCCGTKDLLTGASPKVFGSVRSILLFNYDDQLTEPLLGNWLRKCRLLKVLNLTNARIAHLPKDLGNLWHLKYLNLRNTKVKTLPKSICKLQNLEALDLLNTSVCELPVEISKLPNLRHIYCLHQDRTEPSLEKFRGLKRHKGIGSLGELQTLTCVEVDDRGVGLIKELEMLRQLRILGICKLTKELGTSLCFSFQRWDHLERLTLVSTSENEILDLQEISSPPRFLWRVTLVGRLLKFPDWIPKLQNLCMLCLFFSRLSDDDPFNYLKRMPNLEYLYLHKAYDGAEIHIKEGGFRKLKQLELSGLCELRVMKIDREALPLLEELGIGSCPKLKEAPSNIQHLRSLKLVEISDMPMEFVLGMQPEEGQACWKVKQVPYISSMYKNQGNIYDFL